jgi:tetratricopeptide (TPR) repeat protein
MNMKRLSYITALLLSFVWTVSAQNAIKVEAPDVVALDEQFNVTFIIEGEKNPSNFSWSAGDDFQLVWGPQRGSSSYTQILNGKRTTSRQTTFTYILMPKGTGTFTVPVATATVDGEPISSSPASIQVVSDGASTAGRSQAGGSAAPDRSGGQAAATGDIARDDLFLRLSLSRTDVVLGEPITATLKLYQRVDIAGFENVKFPTFNGFWSQETYSPTNIEFRRESLDDRIYNTAVLRSYVLIPQQSGSIIIDPAELVCLVNVRTGSSTSSSIFDSFFQDDYVRIRKRITTPAYTVRVSPLPAGQPASFGGGVGNFGISARLTGNSLKTHDAASLIVTVSGRGNVSLLEEPKVTFPPDFEVYDTKTTENSDKSTGRTSGSKSFEFPFIPRSAGDFTIAPIEYSYYDINAGKYVTLRTEPLEIKVARGKTSESPSPVVQTGVDRKDVQSLADDIRFIVTKHPALVKKGSFFVGSSLFSVLAALLIVLAVAAYFFLRKAAAMKADVVGAKNRRATKMALKRLKQAGDFLDKNLYTAFYESLHQALIGFISDKLNMDMTDINKENIAAALSERGASDRQTRDFTDLLDACEFARYAPDAGHEAMRAHFDGAVASISSLDASLKNVKSAKPGVSAVIALLLGLFSASLFASETADSLLSLDPLASGDSLKAIVQQPGTMLPSSPDSLWLEGVRAYSDSRFQDASDCWLAILEKGVESVALHYNLGNAYYMQGNYPKAVLYYEKALKLDPSDSDARYNLEFTNSFVQDKIKSVPEFILKNLARKTCYLLSSNAWAVLFLVLLALALTTALIFLLAGSRAWRRRGFYSAVVLFLLAFSALGFAQWQRSVYRKADSAIVMIPVASVKSSPSESSAKDLFILHEGTKVKILDEVGSWKNISLADGRQGWIPADNLEII